MSLLPSCLLSLFFLFPCLSSSCPLKPESIRLPCNNSIEIRPPFYLMNESIPFCDNAISVKCGSDFKGLQVYLFRFAAVWFFLENILYASDNHILNKLVVRDLSLEELLNSLNCGNLLLSFPSPSHEYFDYDRYLSFSQNITSFCGSRNLSSQSPIMGTEYTLNYSATTDELPANCYKKAPNASFEWTFSFDDDGRVFLLSAQYSHNLLPHQGCFSQSIGEGDCGEECNATEG